jgi:outer membrane protein assembly factor BamB
VQWQEDSVGAATVTLAGDHLLILTERGELIRAAASPSGFKAEQRVQALPFQVRAYPALADGCLYARSKDKLFCLDLSKGKN